MRLLVGAVSLVLLVSACGGKQAAAQTRIVGANASQQRLLRQVLARIAPTQVTAVHVVPKTRTWTCGAPPGALEFVIQAPNTLRGQWDATLLGNLYFDAAARLKMQRDDVVRLWTSPDACLSRVALPSSTSRTTLSSLRRTVTSSGATVVELRRVAGGIALTVESDHPAAFAKAHYSAIRRRIAALSPRLFFFGVVDAKGVSTAATAQIGNDGASYKRP